MQRQPNSNAKPWAGARLQELLYVTYTHAIASAIATHAYNISQSEYNIDSFQSHKYKNKDCAECDQFIADWEAGGVRQLLYSGSVE